MVRETLGEKNGELPREWRQGRNEKQWTDKEVLRRGAKQAGQKEGVDTPSFLFVHSLYTSPYHYEFSNLSEGLSCKRKSCESSLSSDFIYDWYSNKFNDSTYSENSTSSNSLWKCIWLLFIFDWMPLCVSGRLKVDRGRPVILIFAIGWVGSRWARMDFVITLSARNRYFISLLELCHSDVFSRDVHFWTSRIFWWFWKTVWCSTLADRMAVCYAWHRMDVNLAVMEIQQSHYSTAGRDGAEQSEPLNGDKR